MSEIEDGSTIMKGTEADKAAGLLSLLVYLTNQIFIVIIIFLTLIYLAFT